VDAGALLFLVYVFPADNPGAAHGTRWAQVIIFSPTARSICQRNTSYLFYSLPPSPNSNFPQAGRPPPPQNALPMIPPLGAPLPASRIHITRSAQQSTFSYAHSQPSPKYVTSSMFRRL
jgi:hypothetical protein